MAQFTIVGAGPIGRETASLLAKEGHGVRLLSRSATGIDAQGVEPFAIDATDARAVADVAGGSEAIFMCAMAAYTRWPTDFPPIMEGVVTAAERVGSKLLVAGNVYGYGATAEMPLSPTLSLKPGTRKGRVRADMWRRASDSRVPAMEVRASDFLGSGAASLFTLMTLPALLKGEPAPVVGDIDALHAWSFTKDVARTLVAAAKHAGEWNRALHVPSPHASVREVASRICEAAGAPAPKFAPIDQEALGALAETDRLMREILEIAYLYDSPLILDASWTERELGVFASDLATAVSDTLAN